MTPWQYVKAIGLPVVNVIFCAGWLAYDLATFRGWERPVFSVWFALLLALSIWEVPRSLRSYRRMVESTRRLGQTRAKLLLTLVRKGYPPEVIVRVNELLMANRPAEAVELVQQHHPERRWPSPF